MGWKMGNLLSILRQCWYETYETIGVYMMCGVWYAQRSWTCWLGEGAFG